MLGRTLDELPPQTRRLLDHIHKMTTAHCTAEQIEQKDYRFTRRDVRQSIGWTDFQIKKHMNRLQDMEYVLIHRGGRGQSFVYELLYQGEGEDGESFLLGLADMETLNYDANKKPQNQNKEPSSCPQVAAKLPPGSTGKNATKPAMAGHSEDADKKPQKCTSKPKNNGASYDGQEAQVSRAQGSAGATRSHNEPQTSPALAADGV